MQLFGANRKGLSLDGFDKLTDDLVPSYHRWDCCRIYYDVLRYLFRSYYTKRKEARMSLRILKRRQTMKRTMKRMVKRMVNTMILILKSHSMIVQKAKITSHIRSESC